ncbi:LuxR C-terminal-related transcriptional regulator [Actinoplanes sp. NPDC051859]|uniref:helix-turn-helix transcriptional regulator n=1 Tax=Actinoplanes sp. NPDC051859 TaxID=3363909 RepID=UPI003795A6F9
MTDLLDQTDLLDHDDVLRSCAAAFGAPPAAQVRVLIAEAGGDPAWTRALIDGLTAEGRVRIDTGLAVLVRDGLPESVLELIRVELAKRQPECRHLLCVAAVLGPALDPDRIADLAGRPTAALLPAWQEAIDAGLLRVRGGELEFAHETLRRAIAATVPSALRRALVREQQATVSLPPPPVPVLAGRLTGREQLVLAQVARGRSNQQIARSLGISGNAVKRHVSNLLMKSGCTNRTEVALLAVSER